MVLDGGLNRKRMNKQCAKCQKVKPTNQFNKNKTEKDGFGRWCKMCLKKHRQKPSVKKHSSIHQREYRQQPTAREHIKTYLRGYHQRTKLSGLHLVGGTCCALCGCKEPIFLTIDHSDCNGKEHRKYVKGNIYNWLIRATNAELNKWKLRVLCWNCQMATVHNNNEIVKTAITREHNRIKES